MRLCRLDGSCLRDVEMYRYGRFRLPWNGYIRIGLSVSFIALVCFGWLWSRRGDSVKYSFEKVAIKSRLKNSTDKKAFSNIYSFWYLLKLRSDGSRLSEPLDIIAAIEKSVPFFEAAAATAAAAAVALQWFDAPSSMIDSIVFHFVQVYTKVRVIRVNVYLMIFQLKNLISIDLIALLQYPNNKLL